MRYLIFLLCILGCQAKSNRVDFTPALSGEAVEISITLPQNQTGRVSLYRSTSDFAQMTVLDLDYEPIVKWEFPAEESISFCDTAIPQGERLYYYCRVVGDDGKVLVSEVQSLITPVALLPESAKDVAMVIDKRHYVLTVFQGDIALKRYALNMGGSPKNRKLHFDNASTPEGRYRLNYFNNNSQFHRSMAVSYPNDKDRARYAKALKEGSIPLVGGAPAKIGGSIMIHGGGVWNNWTWGCMAMDNDNIDELMDCGFIKVGTPILIGGYEFSVNELMEKQ